MAEELNVEVEIDLCVGTGQCEMLVPEVFTVGDDGVVELHPDAVADADPTLLRRAVRNCPTAALQLAD